ncbi:hypothetical protein O6H91_08G101900 [Diphasiastrum complanatum]|uniref:Uncharacterized protein n=1 Tax=Diphasiastrum complanatum TaxID=34168 RepID=A0ACC2D0F5_DIPCM|nr:hypothetical protein O6H91_08G101900 [Diphasiastrum complanatum]
MHPRNYAAIDCGISGDITMNATLSLRYSGGKPVGSPKIKLRIIHHPGIARQTSVAVSCSEGCRLKPLLGAGNGSVVKSNGLGIPGLGRRCVRNDEVVTCSRQDSSAAETVEVGQNQLQFTHKVSVDIAAPVELVWCIWTDLQNAPSWMRWIDRVELVEDGTSDASNSTGLNSLSRWFCSTSGFEVSWIARIDNIEVTPPRRILRWVTISGLQSVGEVSFTENSIGTSVELKIDYAFPHSLGQLMTSDTLKSLIQATLQSDLERFHQYTLTAAGTVQPATN